MPLRFRGVNIPTRQPFCLTLPSPGLSEHLPRNDSMKVAALVNGNVKQNPKLLFHSPGFAILSPF
jgi:hypothetical protein